jgi:hypothetical protein
MPRCQQCNEQHDLTFTLNNVSDNTGSISSIRSRFVVCASCKNELEDNEEVTW